MSNYGKGNVSAGQPSGDGTLIDIVLKLKDDHWFYEIKTSLTGPAGSFPQMRGCNNCVTNADLCLTSRAKIFKTRRR